METTISRLDLDDQFNWSEIHTIHDENGVICVNKVKVSGIVQSRNVSDG